MQCIVAHLDRFVNKQTVDVFETKTLPLDKYNKEFIDHLKGVIDNTRVVSQ